MFKSSLPLEELVVKVTVFLCIPGLLDESNLTFIVPVSPGLIGTSLGYSGTVQPQLPVAFNILKSEFPELENVKIVSTISPSLISPKS